MIKRMFHISSVLVSQGCGREGEGIGWNFLRGPTTEDTMPLQDEVQFFNRC